MLYNRKGGTAPPPPLDLPLAFIQLCYPNRHTMPSNLQAKPLPRPLSITWRREGDSPIGVYRAQTLHLEGKLFLGAGDTLGQYNIIQEYDVSTHTWSQLPECPVERAALAELNQQLVLAGSHYKEEVIGGHYLHADNNTRITAWDKETSEWFHPYPHMDTGRSYAAAVGYQKNLVVACGLSGEEEVGAVEMLECTSRTWHRVEAVPIQGHHMSSAVIGKHWYLSAHHWRDNKPHVFSAHLPTLVSQATASTAPATVWCELMPPPMKGSTLLAHSNHLLLVGGLKKDFQKDIHCYDPLADKWVKCGTLPAKMSGCSCAELPSGELLVTGGYVKGQEGYSRQVWIGKVAMK